MQQHGGQRALPLDLGARAPVVRQRLDELTRRARIRLALGQPEHELRQGIAQRLREHGADLLGCAGALAHVVLELLHCSQPVRAGTVEAAVDDALHARPQGPERERDDERRAGRHPVGATADGDARDERDCDVGRCEQQGQRAVDRGAVDEALDRVEPVADDRDADGDGQCDRHQHQDHEERQRRRRERRCPSRRSRSAGRGESGSPPRRSRASAAARHRTSGAAAGGSRPPRRRGWPGCRSRTAPRSSRASPDGGLPPSGCGLPHAAGRRGRCRTWPPSGTRRS